MPNDLPDLSEVHKGRWPAMRDRPMREVMVEAQDCDRSAYVVPLVDAETVLENEIAAEYDRISAQAQEDNLEVASWELVIDQVVGLSTLYDIDVNPRTAQEVHDAWAQLVPIIAYRAEEALRAAGLELICLAAERIRMIVQRMTSEPFDGSLELARLADELDPPAATDEEGTP